MFIFGKKKACQNYNSPITIIKKPDSFMTITDITCYDEVNRENFKKEKETIQIFLDKVLEEKECVITGCFYAKKYR